MAIESPLLLIGLVVIASISPLLTLAALWQTKEWRIDRLKEHFRAEGAFRQLFGLVRPILLGILGILGIVGLLPSWHVWLLLILAALSIAQILLQRQRTPVWTKKALVLVTTSTLITCLASLAILNFQFPAPRSLGEVGSIFNFQFLTVIPLLQSLTLALSWILFFPLDRALKMRIMNQAKALRALHPDLTVIGITGSVGKTTTKELLAHILRDSNPLVTPAYVNSDMGVAHWLLKELTNNESRITNHESRITNNESRITNNESQITNHKSRVLIAELGAYRRGEISLLCSIVKPQIGVLTFIGKQHIALFGSQEALCEAKAELLDSLPEDGAAFLNADCELCANLAEHARCPVTTVGTGGYADIEAFDCEETSKGIRFRTGETVVDVPLHGTHNVSNVLLAMAVARKLGMTEEQIAGKLRSFTPPSHTFSVRNEKGRVVLDDTHNASPASFKSAIAWARTQPMTSKILLTSGLMELGAEQDRIHAELGALSSGIFTRVIVSNKRAAEHIERGFGRPIELFDKSTEPIDEHALLACVGRIPASTIEHLLQPAKRETSKRINE